MEANRITVTETVPASRKLREADARTLLKDATTLIVAKGKTVSEFPGGGVSTDAVAAMLGPTGNLRAPTMRVGTTLLVGFNEAALASALR